MKIKTDTILRTVILIVALVNQALTVAGKSLIPITDEQITEFISLAVTIGASLWAWWKNNSFTPEAIEGDRLMKELKENGNK